MESLSIYKIFLLFGREFWGLSINSPRLSIISATLSINPRKHKKTRMYTKVYILVPSYFTARIKMRSLSSCGASGSQSAVTCTCEKPMS